MSRNMLALKKRAAAMLVVGYNLPVIAKELNIRYATLVRWTDTELFETAMMKARRQIEQRIELRLLRMIDDCMDATRKSMEYEMDDELGSGRDGISLRETIAMLKAIGKEKVFCAADRLGTPKQAKTSQKQARKTTKISTEPAQTST